MAKYPTAKELSVLVVEIEELFLNDQFNQLGQDFFFKRLIHILCDGCTFKEKSIRLAYLFENAPITERITISFSKISKLFDLSNCKPYSKNLKNMGIALEDMKNTFENDFSVTALIMRNIYTAYISFLKDINDDVSLNKDKEIFIKILSENFYILEPATFHKIIGVLSYAFPNIEEEVLKDLY